MNKYLKNIYKQSLAAWAIAVLPVMAVAAPPLPGPADIDRIKPQLPEAPAPAPQQTIVNKAEEQEVIIPEEAKSIRFILNSVKVNGVTAFSENELQETYSEYLKQEISLDKVWKIAADITKLYQSKGYFLSRAYVPAQELENGNVIINVVEGYVGDIEAPVELNDSSIAKGLVSEIIQQKPLNIKKLESLMLLVNDIPGINYQAVISPLDDPSREGAVKLVLAEGAPRNNAVVSFDSYGSRFLGPYQLSASYEPVILPFQKTRFSSLMSMPADELRYFNLGHYIPLTGRDSIEVTGAYTVANPGYTLALSDISSNSVNLGLQYNHQFIRQRDDNLKASLKIEGLNSNSDIIDTALTRDRVRTMRAIVAYDGTDMMNGYNYLNLTFSQGLDLFGASEVGGLYVSRLDAKPNFRKAEFNLTRFQNFSQDWGVTFALNGQVASGSLYSSEEFGYGGSVLGRAYDSSEISGDNGISSLIELKYMGLQPLDEFYLVPYAFYDIGKVWNKNIDQLDESASSTGVGLRVQGTDGLAFNMTYALPLTRQISTPIYGNNGENPKLTFSLSYGF